MNSSTQPPRPGRRRSEDSRQAILGAAFDLCAEVGYGGLTIEGIAARSGAGKQTVYRWWESKADVLLEALAAKADLHVPLPDQGSCAADLRAFLGATFGLGGAVPVVDMLRALMAQAQIDPEFGRRFRLSFLQRRRDAIATVLRRASERGDLAPEVSGETAIDVVFGVMWYRLLATAKPLDGQLIDELVGLLARSVPHTG